jgi:cbb3-type cytochrome oxidase maturation protein
MGVMPLLVICSVMVAGGFLFAFLWATRSGQFDDTVTPSIKMLFEDRRRNRGIGE